MQKKKSPYFCGDAAHGWGEEPKNLLDSGGNGQSLFGLYQLVSDEQEEVLVLQQGAVHTSARIFNDFLSPGDGSSFRLIKASSKADLPARISLKEAVDKGLLFYPAVQ